MNKLSFNTGDITLLRKIMLFMFFLLLAALLHTTAKSQTTGGGGSIGLGPQLGFYKAQDGDGLRLMGGAALRMKLSDGLGIEGSINYRNDEYQNGSVQVQNWPVMVTGLLYPLPVVYGAIGAGWYNSSVEYNFPFGSPGSSLNGISDSQQEFGWHFGAGAELPAGSSTKLYGDFRYVFLDYDFQQFPGSDGVNSDFYVITFGLLFGLE